METVKPFILERNKNESFLDFKERANELVNSKKQETGRNVTKSPVGGRQGMEGAKKYIITVW